MAGALWCSLLYYRIIICCGKYLFLHPTAAFKLNQGTLLKIVENKWVSLLCMNVFCITFDYSNSE